MTVFFSAIGANPRAVFVKMNFSSCGVGLVGVGMRNVAVSHKVGGTLKVAVSYSRECTDSRGGNICGSHRFCDRRCYHCAFVQLAAALAAKVSSVIVP